MNTSLSAESVFQLTSTSGLAPPFLQVSVKVLAVAAPSVKVARASPTREIKEAGSVAVLVVFVIGSWSLVLAEAIVASGRTPSSASRWP